MQIIKIGRDPGNQIILNDSFVSRHHAEIIITTDGQVRIKDLKSTNGTYINDICISESYLKKGDILKCGNSIVNWPEIVSPYLPKAEFMNTSEISNPIKVNSSEPSVIQQTGISSESKVTSTVNPLNTSAFWGSVLVLGGFFMPWIKIWGVGISGARIASFIADSKSDENIYAIFLYLLPISAVIFIISALSGKVSEFALSVRFVPIILFVLSILVLVSKNGIGSIEDEEDLNYLKAIGIGFILTIIGASMMCYYPKKNIP